MPNTKLRCTVCKGYFPRSSFYGAGCCTEECFRELQEMGRRRRQRRSASTKKRWENHRKRSSISGDLKRRVRNRDGNCCRYCGSPRNLHVHHIEYLSQGGANRAINLITLCDEHHAVIHSDKRRYQPLCRGYIWLLYVEGIKATISEVERWAVEGIPHPIRRSA